MVVDARLKYQPFPVVEKTNRRWPNRTITAPPLWCSVDLRDGNQALIEPMNHERKMRLFRLLVDCGFKQIEIGFPAASQTDYDFTRYLIEHNCIPDDVAVQVLTQARDTIIDRTFEALRGAKQAIVHLYNSTSPLQRQVVFNLPKTEIIRLAEQGARRMQRLAAQQPDTQWQFEYSPESFTATELDFSLEICQAVQHIWQPTSAQPMIINLPATVEMSTPNIYADQIEWFADGIPQRDSVLISAHPHNDRGTAVAAAELAMMAGADRIEGTLFGNGERTGNVDIVTLALNMYTQGINSGLNFSDMNHLVQEFEFCNQMTVPARHPYAGELVFTAFSGSHQDAIKKGLARQKTDSRWAVPYLPIDPQDVGRSYEAIIRVNSQSGKGGLAYVLQAFHGLQLPRALQIEFSQFMQQKADQQGGEIGHHAIWQAFRQRYLPTDSPWQLLDYQHQAADGSSELQLQLRLDGKRHQLQGRGNGPIAAAVQALRQILDESIQVVDYAEHALGEGAAAQAVAYVHMQYADQRCFGVAMDASIVTASLKALLVALARAQQQAQNH